MFGIKWVIHPEHFSIPTRNILKAEQLWGMSAFYLHYELRPWSRSYTLLLFTLFQASHLLSPVKAAVSMCLCVGAGDWARALCMLGKYCQNQATTSVSHVSIYWGLPSVATYMWLAICLPHKLLSHLLFSFYLMPPNCIFYCTVCL